MLLTIIIVNYNGARFLKNCLDSVLSQKKYNTPFKVILFDNASTDDSFNALEPYLDEIELVKNPTNIGFPQAHNQLLPELNTPFLWLLNNDTEFDQNIDIISPILNHFSTDNSIVGISPKLLNTDGSVQVQGSGLAGLKYKTSKIKQVSFLSGASLFIKTSFFKKINGFDPNLFFYNDDIDFAMQVKKHKMRLIYYPLLKVTHHGGLSTKFQQIETRIGGYIGSLYLCRKYYSSFTLYIYKQFIKLLIWIQFLYYKSKSAPEFRTWPEQLKTALERIKNEL